MHRHTNKTYMQHNYAAHNTRYNTTPHTHTEHNLHTILHNIDITIHINLNTGVRTVIHIYSFDFITYNNISKNSIIQLYTKFIHFGHLIDEVSKITNIDILIKLISSYSSTIKLIY